MLGAVAPTALLVPAAAAALVGSAARRRGARARRPRRRARPSKPIDDKRGTIAYRKQITGVLVTRAAAIAAERARRAPRAHELDAEEPGHVQDHVRDELNGEPAEFLCEPQRERCSRRCATSSS